MVAAHGLEGCSGIARLIEHGLGGLEACCMMATSDSFSVQVDTAWRPPFRSFYYHEQQVLASVGDEFFSLSGILPMTGSERDIQQKGLSL